MISSLQVKDLSLSFHSKDKTTVIFDQLSAEFKAGELTAIVGPSGAGKSTLLRVISGFQRPQNGTVQIRPSDGVSGPSREIRKGECGFIFQDFGVVPRMTALETVCSGALGRLHWSCGLLGLYPRAIQEHAKSILNDLGLKGKEASRVDIHLSGGEKQRTAIGRTLMQEPSILLADEPIANLDHAAAINVMDILQSVVLSRGLIGLVVLHDLEIARQYASRIMVLKEGRLTEAHLERKKYNLVIVGGGVGAISTLHHVTRPLTEAAFPGFDRQSPFKIALVERNLDHIGGGTAFSLAGGKGLFNNPYRLLHERLREWIWTRRESISSLLAETDGFSAWLDANKPVLESAGSEEDLAEVYFPRILGGLWLRNMAAESLDQGAAEHRHGSVSVDLFEGEVDLVEKGGSGRFNVAPVNGLTGMAGQNRWSLFNFELGPFIRGAWQDLQLEADQVVVANGETERTAQAGMVSLPWELRDDVLRRLKKGAECVRVISLGTGSIFLESLWELQTVLRDGQKVQMVGLSSTGQVPMRGELSRHYCNSRYQLKHFNQILSASLSPALRLQNLLNWLVEEYEAAEAEGYSRYDVWTTVLESAVLNEFVESLDPHHRTDYDLYCKPKLRELTRFTNPALVDLCAELQAAGRVSLRSGGVKSVLFGDEIHLGVVSDGREISLSADVLIGSLPKHLLSVKATGHTPRLSGVAPAKNQKVVVDASYQSVDTPNLFVIGARSSRHNSCRETQFGAAFRSGEEVATSILTGLSAPEAGGAEIAH